MKRFVPLLLLSAATIPVVLLVGSSAEASPDATIRVNSTGDTNSRDSVLTLREATLLATGGLTVGDLDSGECAQVSNSTWGPPCSISDSIGAASADTIVFDTAVFPPGAAATIDLGSTLPTLSTGNDTVDGSSAGVIVDGVTKAFDCFDITSNGNSIKGLQIYRCVTGIYLHAGAQSNAIGGSTSSERNVISANGEYGVRIDGAGTNGNTVKGNYIGTNAAGDASLTNGSAGVLIAYGAQDNAVGGSGSGERNIISGNVGLYGYGVWLYGSGTTNNTVKGNYIGTNAGGGAAVPNNWGVVIEEGAGNNTIGGTTSSERNVISGSVADGMMVGGNGNTVKGNYIGTDAVGEAALPNGSSGGGGVYAWGHNTIGGSTTGERNIISGNTGYGVWLGGLDSGNTVEGNYIGTNAAGDAAVPNGLGVRIWSSGGNSIGGAAAGEGNVISGNTGYGVWIFGGGSGYAGNTVKGNYIGTNAAGNAVLPNGSTGVRLENSTRLNTIGGSTSGERNVISGNAGHGVHLAGATGGHYTPVSDNTVRGNYIGTNAAGDAALPNALTGVLIDGCAENNTVGGTSAGEGNVIAYSTGDGVEVDGGSRVYTTANTIRHNSIHSNGGKGIDNVAGGNLELAPPVIDSVGGSVSGHTEPKCYPCTVEVFSDDADEGRIFHGSTTTNDDATGTWTYAGAVTGPNVTATITDASGNTSEFSAPVAYSPPVGGIAELPDIAGSGDSPPRNHVALAEAAAALLALIAGAWYARRRWGR